MGKIRKKTKLNFINEFKIPKTNRAKDKMVKGVPKLKSVQGVKYKKGNKKVARPWLLLIEESDNLKPSTMMVPKFEKSNRGEKDFPSGYSLENYMLPLKEENKDYEQAMLSRRSIAQID